MYSRCSSFRGLSLVSVLLSCLLLASGLGAGDEAGAGGRLRPTARPLGSAKQSAKEAAKKAKELQRQRLKELQGPYKKWLNEDVRWIITPEEESRPSSSLRTTKSATSSSSNSGCVAIPTPDYTRTTSSRTSTTAASRMPTSTSPPVVPGWRTDRGHMYIVWGCPTSRLAPVRRHLSARCCPKAAALTSTYPFERWRYRYLEGVGQEVSGVSV